MRRFALLLISLFVLSAVPVSAQEAQYYVLSFDGKNDYGLIPSGLTTPRPTMIFIFRGENLLEGPKIIRSDPWRYIVGFTPSGKPWLELWDDNNTRIASFAVDYPLQNNTVYCLAFTYGTDGVIRAYINGQLVDAYTALVNNDVGVPDHVYVGTYDTSVGWFKGNIYAILIYNRALSDTEIQQIYNDPMDPPTDGLVLWFAPDSVDVVNNVWSDKSGNNNHGTIVGATAERVSIIRVRDYKTNADITLKSTITNLDTGETLSQLLPVVDYNTPTTIKVEAQGYKTQIIKLGGFKPLYTVYMQPLLTELQIKFNVANYFPTAMWFLVAGVMGSIVAGIFSMSDRVGRKAKVVVVIVLGLIFFIYMLQFAL